MGKCTSGGRPTIKHNKNTINLKSIKSAMIYLGLPKLFNLYLSSIFQISRGQCWPPTFPLCTGTMRWWYGIVGTCLTNITQHIRHTVTILMAPTVNMSQEVSLWSLVWLLQLIGPPRLSWFLCGSAFKTGFKSIKGFTAILYLRLSAIIRGTRILLKHSL